MRDFHVCLKCPALRCRKNGNDRKRYRCALQDSVDFYCRKEVFVKKGLEVCLQHEKQMGMTPKVCCHRSICNECKHFSGHPSKLSSWMVDRCVLWKTLSPVKLYKNPYFEYMTAPINCPYYLELSLLGDKSARQ